MKEKMGGSTFTWLWAVASKEYAAKGPMFWMDLWWSAVRPLNPVTN